MDKKRYDIIKDSITTEVSVYPALRDGYFDLDDLRHLALEVMGMESEDPEFDSLAFIRKRLNNMNETALNNLGRYGKTVGEWREIHAEWKHDCKNCPMRAYCEGSPLVDEFMDVAERLIMHWNRFGSNWGRYPLNISFVEIMFALKKYFNNGEAHDADTRSEKGDQEI